MVEGLLLLLSVVDDMLVEGLFVFFDILLGLLEQRIEIGMVQSMGGFR